MGNTAISRSLLTDHSIGLTLHQLAEIMEGRLQPVIDAVVAHFQAERLKAENANIA
jgi:peptide chain release factor 1